MNILLINHYAGSPFHGMEFRPFYLAREWTRMGHAVQIVAASFSHVRVIQPKFEGDKFDEQVDGINYRWYRVPEYSGNGIGRVRNILRFLRRLWMDSKILSQQFRPDVVIASSTYPMDIWPARRIARLAGARLVFEVHDLWPLSPMELGGLSRWHPFIMWVQYAEDFAYRHSDRVVSMLPNAKEHMISRGMAPEKYSHVPNGIALEDWKNPKHLPPKVSATLGSLKQAGLPLVGYAGNFGLANALDLLLDAAVLLSGKAQFVLIGKGPDAERLASRIADEGIGNIVLLPSIEKAAIPSFLQAIDIAYIGWRRNPLYRFGISPNKLMDYMMAGKPIVHSVSAGNDPVREAGCGITVPPDDAKAVASAIMELAAMPAVQREKMGLSGKEYVLKSHTYSVLARRFVDIIECNDDQE